MSIAGIASGHWLLWVGFGVVLTGIVLADDALSQRAAGGECEESPRVRPTPYKRPKTARPVSVLT